VFGIDWLDGPNGDAAGGVAERCSELLGFDAFGPPVLEGETSYESQVTPARGFYLLERLMDGCYTKYNNNSFWPNRIDAAAGRNTPQAFTHFTYKASNRELLICDIQGVGDFYTDPQIHTVNPEMKRFIYNSGAFWDAASRTGILSVLLSHAATCHNNEVCGTLGLKSFWWDDSDLNNEIREQAEEMRREIHMVQHKLQDAGNEEEIENYGETYGGDNALFKRKKWT